MDLIDLGLMGMWGTFCKEGNLWAFGSLKFLPGAPCDLGTSLIDFPYF